MERTAACLPGMVWGAVPALLSGLCTAIAIECCQLWAGRAFDIDGVLLNTLGFLFWKALAELMPETVTAFHVREREESE